jgi:hypothetical protein
MQNNRINYRFLIDCEHKTLIEAPESCQYIALSYVWGTDPFLSDDIEVNKPLPQPLPATIDNVSVSLNLGIRYLWIARYCIPQNNNPIKQGIIRQMDQIYCNSYATIIIAASVFLTYGLPGISRERRPCFKVRIGDCEFTPLLPDPRVLIRNSSWMTRAWTYQEALLSTRRIFFTDDQLYFEYGEMLQYESFRSSVDTNGNFLPRLEWGPGKRLFPSTSMFDYPWCVFDRIVEYTWRELSYPSDILNGAMGFLRTFEDSKYPFKHLWGVLVFTPVSECFYIRFASLRGTKEGFLFGLHSFIIHPSVRHVGFPSWSWSGWHARVVDGDLIFDWQTRRNLEWSTARSCADITIFLETTSGESQTWETFGASTSAMRFNYAPTLLINTYTISVSIRMYDRTFPENDPHTRLLGPFVSFRVNDIYTHYQRACIFDSSIDAALKSGTVAAIGIFLADLTDLKTECPV